MKKKKVKIIKLRRTVKIPPEMVHETKKYPSPKRKRVNNRKQIEEEINKINHEK